MNTLILNADYSPLDIRHFSRVIHRPSFTVVKWYDKTIRDGRGNTYKVPAVVVIKKHVKSIYRPAKFSKRNVYIRDNFTCQYTGRQYNRSELTIDHIVPKSRLRVGFSTYENTVVCHRTVNRRKANKTPEEVGLKLIRPPRTVTVQELLLLKLQQYKCPHWEEYINVKQEKK